MHVEFDPGPSGAFATLCAQYPGVELYPPRDFRTEWGPVFYRGRLDGSARVLAIGQDPSAHEVAGRRILLGTAGHRVQGFLARLGITHSYVMVNTYLYGVYGNTGLKHQADPAIAQYRERWFDAIFASSPIEVVIAFGSLADDAWRRWGGAREHSVAYAHVTHPTQPNSASKGDPNKLRQLEAALLANWNEALVRLRPVIAHPDATALPGTYGAKFKAADLVPIPAADLAPGCPAWMREAQTWAERLGTTPKQKRRTIQISATLD